MTEEKSKTTVVSEGKRFRELIKDGITVHQEKDFHGNWIARFSIKEYSKEKNKEV